MLHSGTVGAALTGANMGISGVAVSVAPGSDPGSGTRFDTAAVVGVAALAWAVTAPTRTVLNVNVPDVGGSTSSAARAGRPSPRSGRCAPP